MTIPRGKTRPNRRRSDIAARRREQAISDEPRPTRTCSTTIGTAPSASGAARRPTRRRFTARSTSASSDRGRGSAIDDAASFPRSRDLLTSSSPQPLRHAVTTRPVRARLAAAAADAAAAVPRTRAASHTCSTQLRPRRRAVLRRSWAGRVALTRRSRLWLAPLSSRAAGETAARADARSACACAWAPAMWAAAASRAARGRRPARRVGRVWADARRPPPRPPVRGLDGFDRPGVYGTPPASDAALQVMGAPGMGSALRCPILADTGITRPDGALAHRHAHVAPRRHLRASAAHPRRRPLRRGLDERGGASHAVAALLVDERDRVVEAARSGCGYRGAPGRRRAVGAAVVPPSAAVGAARLGEGRLARARARSWCRRGRVVARASKICAISNSVLAAHSRRRAASAARASPPPRARATDARCWMRSAPPTAASASSPPRSSCTCAIRRSVSTTCSRPPSATRAVAVAVAAARPRARAALRLVLASARNASRGSPARRAAQPRAAPRTASCDAKSGCRRRRRRPHVVGVVVGVVGVIIVVGVLEPDPRHAARSRGARRLAIGFRARLLCAVVVHSLVGARAGGVGAAGGAQRGLGDVAAARARGGSGRRRRPRGGPLRGLVVEIAAERRGEVRADASARRARRLLERTLAAASAPRTWPSGAVRERSIAERRRARRFCARRHAEPLRRHHAVERLRVTCSLAAAAGAQRRGQRKCT